jgi:hypothetical protein
MLGREAAWLLHSIPPSPDQINPARTTDFRKGAASGVNV